MSFTSFDGGTRWSDIYAVAACSFLAGTAMFSVQFSLALHFQSTGRGGVAVAALIICITLPLVVLSPITGRMADRFDSRALMAFSGVLQAAAIFGMTFTDDVVALMGLAVLNAVGTAILQPTAGALVPAISAPADLPRAVATVQTGILLGLASGPATAGFMVGTYGIDSALTLAAGAAALRALLSCDIRTRRGGIRRAPVTAAAAAPKWNLRGDRLLQAMVIGTGAVIASLSVFNILEVFLVREVYGAPETMYGLINACWTIGMAGGAWIAAAIISRLKRDGQLALLLMGALALTCLLCVVVGLPLPTVFILIPLYLVGGVLNATENSATQVSIARRVPERFRGRAGARVGAVLNASTLIGFGLGGVLSQLMEIRTSFIVVGLFGLAVLACCMPMVRRAVRDDDTVADARAPERELAAA